MIQLSITFTVLLFTIFFIETINPPYLHSFPTRRSSDLSCLLNNFFTLHNDWRDMGICMNSHTAPVQMDANLGFVNAIQEMLIYVSPSIVKLLPALPTKFKQGNVKDLRFMTGRISFSWDKEENKFEATLIAERDTELLLKLPDFCEDYSIIGDDINYEPSEIGKNY